MPKCKRCKIDIAKDKGVLINLKRFCDYTCAAKFGKANIPKGKEIKRKEQKKADKKRKKELMTRAQWYDKLQKLVNQYVKFRDRKKPCCTCGTTSQAIKYDAGHFIPQKGYDPRRFELTNIHKQCSVQCNQHGSGKRAEYREFIRGKYGQEHLEWLEGEVNHKSLKEQFPHWVEIENEISRYRKLIRKAGLKPCV